MTDSTDVAGAVMPAGDEVAVSQAKEDEAPNAAEATAEDIADGDPTIADAATTEAAVGGGTTPPPVIETSEGADLPDNPLAFLASKRVVYQLFGTLLIVGGLLTIGLTVGLSTWNKHQQDSDTQAFLRRVSTPKALSATTPFPSTVSGVLVPNNAQTPTANAATRAAQPVATTSDGNDRSILAPLSPVTTATPVSTAPGSEPTAEVTPTPKPKMPLPTHVTIPSIGVDSDIVEVGVSPVEVDGQDLLTWDVAPYAVGHHFSSASPGEGENVVLSGHDDWQGEVFKNLYKVKQGAEIDVQAGDRVAKYRVDDILLLPEIGEPLEKRLENAKFIGTTGDERLTLVTCWPYGVDDHRVIVIAHPMSQ